MAVPSILPPSMFTLFASCVAIVPRPKDVRAVPPDSVTKFVPSPTIKFPSVGVNPAISSS